MVTSKNLISHSKKKSKNSGYRFSANPFMILALPLALLFTGPIFSATPKDIASFTDACKGKNITTSPRQVEGHLNFDASSVGHPQLDPQISAGGGHVFGASNSTVAVYTKQGELVSAGSPACLNLGIDPKVFFDGLSGRHMAGSWNLYGDPPHNIRISISKSNDPSKGWWGYDFDVPQPRDGGAIGGNKHWIVYSYPGTGGQHVFIIDKKKATAGETLTEKVFPVMTNPGQPVFTYDEDQENLYFVKLNGNSIKVNYITASGEYKTQPEVNHGLGHTYPTRFPQKGGATCSAGDINAKVAVLRNGFIWTTDAVTVNGDGPTRTSVRWYQLDFSGKIIQTGMVDDPSGTIFSGQATIAVNKRNDLMVVFNQSSKNSYPSSRMAYRLHDDPKGELRDVVNFTDGLAANPGPAWGDYSGATIDGDNDIDFWGTNSVTSSNGKSNSDIFQLTLEPDPMATLDTKVINPNIRQENGKLFVKIKGVQENTKLDVYDLKGSKLITVPFSKKGKDFKEAKVSIASLPKGTVVLEVKNNQQNSERIKVVLDPKQ